MTFPKTTFVENCIVNVLSQTPPCNFQVRYILPICLRSTSLLPLSASWFCYRRKQHLRLLTMINGLLSTDLGRCAIRFIENVQYFYIFCQNNYATK